MTEGRTARLSEIIARRNPDPVEPSRGHCRVCGQDFVLAQKTGLMRKHESTAFERGLKPLTRVDPTCPGSGLGPQESMP